MALIVEDGTGKSDADAAVSRDEFKAYCAKRGYDVSTYDDETKVDPAIRRGTTYVSTGFDWPGYKVNRRAQSLAWPRYDVFDQDGEAIPSDSVPSEFRQAVMEAAWYELATGPLLPAVTLTERVKREKVGDIEVEYATAASTADASRPSVPMIDTLVSGLLASGGSEYSGSLVRA